MSVYLFNFYFSPELNGKLNGNIPFLIRPWVLGQVGSPPAATAVTFASIVEEEKQQEAALIRSREKPLALIQVNEGLQHPTAQYAGRYDEPGRTAWKSRYSVCCEHSSDPDIVVYV